MNNLIYNIAITQLPLIGDINAKKLIAYCGSTKEVFKQKLPHLIKIPGIGEATASAIVKGFMPALKRAEEEISFMEKNKIQSFYFLDEQYPKRLKHCEDAPVMLYHKGNSNFENQKSVAIVGTRKATAYGKKMTEKLVEELAPYNQSLLVGWHLVLIFALISRH